MAYSRSPRRKRLAGSAAALCVAFGSAVITASPVGAAAPTPPVKATKSPAILGIHDGAINRCTDQLGAKAAPTKEDYRSAFAATNTSFRSPLWHPLRVTTVRFSPQWDIAKAPAGAEKAIIQNTEKCFAAWLVNAHNAGVTSVEAAFKPDPMYKHTDRGNTTKTAAIPSIGIYKSAVESFIDTFTCARGNTARYCTNRVSLPGRRPAKRPLR